VFLLNFKPDTQAVHLDGEVLTDLLTGESIQVKLQLPGYGSRVLERGR